MLDTGREKSYDGHMGANTGHMGKVEKSCFKIILCGII